MAIGLPLQAKAKYLIVYSMIDTYILIADNLKLNQRNKEELIKKLTALPYNISITKYLVSIA